MHHLRAWRGAVRKQRRPKVVRAAQTLRCQRACASRGERRRKGLTRARGGRCGPAAGRRQRLPRMSSTCSAKDFFRSCHLSDPKTYLRSRYQSLECASPPHLAPRRAGGTSGPEIHETTRTPPSCRFALCSGARQACKWCECGGLLSPKACAFLRGKARWWSAAAGPRCQRRKR